MARPKGIPHSEEHKKYMSKRMKGINLGKTHSAETKLKISLSHKGQKAWNKGLTKETDKRVLKNSIGVSKGLKGNIPWNKGKKGVQSSTRKGKKMSKELCLINKKAAIKFWSSEKSKQAKEKIRKNTVRQHSKKIFPQTNTKIEKSMKSILIENKINFIQEFNFDDRFCCDFAIPEKQIIIECDGDYWHNKKDIKKRDMQKNEYVISKGWKILRFWEHEINSDIDSCVNKIKFELGDC